MNIYDFKVKTRDGKEVSMSEFRGKVLLIVNTATGCGFTPQYEGLEKLYKNYHEKGLEILDFPCDQFGHQAPGTDDEIHEFCTAKYQTSFDQFAKLEVNGDKAVKVPLSIGRQNPQQYEVTSGLKPGDLVIINGYDTFGEAEELLLK